MTHCSLVSFLAPWSTLSHGRTSSLLHRNHLIFDGSYYATPSNLMMTISPADNILSNSDLINGTIIAFLLSFMFSYLNGRTPSSSNIKLWPNEDEQGNRIEVDQLQSQNTTDYSIGNNSAIVFDADNWKDISKPENYILYTQKIRQKESRTSSGLKERPAVKKENRLVLIALLILFVPIFSIEFFFALSRSFICGGYTTQVDDNLWLTDADRALASTNGISNWAKELCSPHQ